MFFGLASGSRFAQLEHRPGGARTLDIVENTFEEQLRRIKRRASGAAGLTRPTSSFDNEAGERQHGRDGAAPRHPQGGIGRLLPAPRPHPALVRGLRARRQVEVAERHEQVRHDRRRDDRRSRFDDWLLVVSGSRRRCGGRQPAAQRWGSGISGVRVDDLGVSTRKVDELVKTLGLDGISKSQVSRCERALRSAIPRRCWTRSVSDDPPACGGLAGSCARPRGRRRTRGSVIASQPRRSGRSSAVGRRPDGGDRVRGARRGVVAPRWGTAGPKARGAKRTTGTRTTRTGRNTRGNTKKRKDTGTRGTKRTR